MNHSFHVYTKNAGLHNDERLTEVLAEVSSMQWDIRWWCSIHVLGKKNAARVAILMHARHKKRAKRNVVLSERVLCLDIQVGKKKSNNRSICPTCRLFRAGFCKLFRTVTWCTARCLQRVSSRNPRRQLMLRNVARSMPVYALDFGWFGLIVTNDDDHHDPLVDTWIFCSAMGITRRIDFIVFFEIAGFVEFQCHRFAGLRIKP